jgi:hypothetical protein
MNPAEHLLHIVQTEEGYPEWRFECVHATDNDKWFCRFHNGDPTSDPPEADGCWFESWWSGVGSELIDIKPFPGVLPIPVKPSAQWAYEEGGTIVFDEATTALCPNVECGDFRVGPCSICGNSNGPRRGSGVTPNPPATRIDA